MVDQADLTVSRARPAAPRQQAGVRTVEFAAWCFLLFLATGPWDMLLSGANPVGLTNTANLNPLYARVNFIIGLIPFSVLVVERNRTVALLLRAWPFLVFLLLAIVLVATAQDPGSSAIRLLGYLETIALVLALFIRLQPSDVVRCLAYVMLVSALCSIATVFVLPLYGLTHGLDIYDNGAGGEWRGIYSHKNVLGHIAGISFGLLVVSGRRLLRPWPLLVLAIVASAICVYKSSSSSGLVIAMALPAVYFCVIKPKGVLRVVSSITLAIVGTCVLIFRGYVVDYVLTALGKSETLSGRTNIWHVATELAAEFPITGAGYGYTTTPPFAALLYKSFAVYDVHNAYLDLLIDLGWLNTAIYLGVFFFALYYAWSRRLSDRAVRVREDLTLLMAAWFLSGADEGISVKPSGFVALVGLIVVFGLYSLKAARGADSGANRERRTFQTKAFQPGKKPLPSTP